MESLAAEKQLFCAVHCNDLFLLQEALMDNPELDVNTPVVDGMTALHFAAEKGYSSCVKILLSAGADVDVSDDFGYTSLMTSVRAGWPLVVKKLLEAGCHCDLTTREGVCAMHMASAVGSSGLVQMLLWAGAEPSLRNRIGDTPLITALKGGHLATVETLLMGCHHVNPNVDSKSDVYSYPLWEALDHQHFTIAKILLLTGYCGWLEIKRYIETYKRSLESTNVVRNRNTGVERTLEPYEIKERLHVIKISGEVPSLQHVCRLNIRKCLEYNIVEKSQRLRLPSRIQEYVCFQDHYIPPALNTEHAVYNFFADQSELY